MNNSAHIVQYLSAKTRWSLQKTEKVFDTLTNLIIKELATGNDLQLADFWQLEVKNLPNRKTVFFKPSADFTPTTCKNLIHLEDDIKTQLKDEGRELPKGFTTEIFTYLKQLLAKEGIIEFGLLGTFQKRESTDSKIVFVPSSYLRQELNRDTQAQQQDIPVQQQRDIPAQQQVEPFSRKPVETDQKDSETRIVASEESKTIVPEESKAVASEESKAVAPEESNEEQSKHDISNKYASSEVNSSYKRKVLYMEPEKKTSGVKSFWYILLIIILLIGLVFGVYKCFPEFFEQSQFVQDVKSTIFST